MKGKKEISIAESLRSLSKFNFKLQVITAVITVVLLLATAISVTQLYTNDYVTVKNQMEIRKDVQTINKRLLFALASNDSEVTAKQAEDLVDRFKKINRLIDVIAKNLGDEALGNQLKANVKAFDDASFVMLDMVEANDAAAVVDYYNTTYNEVSEALADSLDAVGNLADSSADGQYRLILVLNVLAIISLVASVIVVALTFRKRNLAIMQEITSDIDVIKAATREISEGNLHVEIEYDKKNEIGEVADSLKTVVANISEYIDEISVVMKTMATGDFNISFEQEFAGDFFDIQNAIERFSDQISASMDEIMEVSSQVSDGANQMAGAGQNLAESCTNQAMIVDNLSNTLDTITAQISSNSTDATAISKEVTEIAKGIVNGNRMMQEVVKAMESISTSSKEIGNIIDTINSIAEQTNLLSLNASIEAARAGEAGKGFAVVANEVSALAGQTGIAAQNTTDLIQTSLDAVSSGMKVANETAETLNAMVSEVQGIAEKVATIADASTQQASSVMELDTHIAQITSVGENNAATSEKSLALSNEMNEHAGSLKDLISQFTLKK